MLPSMSKTVSKECNAVISKGVKKNNKGKTP
jgi:hypothetical protein